MSHPATYNAHVHSEPSGMLWAEVSELPGCFASGRSLDELREALAESIALYVGDGPGGHTPAVRVDELRLRVPA